MLKKKNLSQRKTRRQHTLNTRLQNREKEYHNVHKKRKGKLEMEVKV